MFDWIVASVGFEIQYKQVQAPVMDDTVQYRIGSTLFQLLITSTQCTTTTNSYVYTCVKTLLHEWQLQRDVVFSSNKLYAMYFFFVRISSSLGQAKTTRTVVLHNTTYSTVFNKTCEQNCAVQVQYWYSTSFPH